MGSVTAPLTALNRLPQVMDFLQPYLEVAVATAPEQGPDAASTQELIETLAYLVQVVHDSGPSVGLPRGGGAPGPHIKDVNELMSQMKGAQDVRYSQISDPISPRSQQINPQLVTAHPTALASHQHLVEVSQLDQIWAVHQLARQWQDMARRNTGFPSASNSQSLPVIQVFPVQGLPDFFQQKFSENFFETKIFQPKNFCNRKFFRQKIATLTVWEVLMV